MHSFAPSMRQFRGPECAVLALKNSNSRHHVRLRQLESKQTLGVRKDDSLFSKRKFNFFAVFLCPLDQGCLELLGILCR